MSSPQPPQGGRPQGLPAQGGPSYPSSPGMAPVGPPPLPVEEYRGTPPPPPPPASGPSGPLPDEFAATADTGPVERMPTATPSPDPAPDPSIKGSVTPGPPAHKHSRAGAAWVALVVAAVVLVFLLIFVTQNSDDVSVHFLGWEGTMSLGVAMMFAAVAGALLVGLLGTVRIFQLRARARRAAAAPAGSEGI